MITGQKLKLWSLNKQLFWKVAKMKSPKGYRERRPPAWESMAPLRRKPWSSFRREEKHRRSSLSERGLESRLNEFQFTSVTTLRTEIMFGVLNRDQVVPSALEFKYLPSRSALE